MITSPSPAVFKQARRSNPPSPACAGRSCRLCHPAQVPRRSFPLRSRPVLLAQRRFPPFPFSNPSEPTSGQSFPPVQKISPGEARPLIVRRTYSSRRLSSATGAEPKSRTRFSYAALGAVGCTYYRLIEERTRTRRKETGQAAAGNPRAACNWGPELFFFLAWRSSSSRTRPKDVETGGNWVDERAGSS